MNMNKILEEAIPHNFERLLSELGLEKRRSAGDYVLPAIGVFAAGVVVGGVLGLLLAPSSGRDLRVAIEKRVATATDHEPAAARRDGSAAQT